LPPDASRPIQHGNAAHGGMSCESNRSERTARSQARTDSRTDRAPRPSPVGSVTLTKKRPSLGDSSRGGPFRTVFVHGLHGASAGHGRHC
jgi:hypothetical protein